MSTAAPLVSVLMPTYNNASYIGEAIESVLEQKLSDFELIISDNASTDATQALVSAYAKRDLRIKYTRNPRNVGISGNFNLCYRRSDPRGRYLAILPSDDAWKPDFLSTLVEVLETRPEVDIAHSDCYRTNERGETLDLLSQHFRNPPTPGPHWALGGLYLGEYFIHTPAAVVRRSNLRRTLPEHIFDETLTYVADYFMWLQLLSAGAKAYYVKTPLLLFRAHEGSITSQSSQLTEAALACLRQEISILDEKTPHLCPPALQWARQEGLSLRLSTLAFRLISLERFSEARPLLQRATRMSPHHRAGKWVAWGITALPLPKHVRQRLFQKVRGRAQARSPQAF